MLTSRQPFWLGWGPELIYLYNDPYKSIIGGKHPRMLGQPTRVVWEEIWEVIAPMLSTAMRGDEGTYVESQLLIMERHGYREETYYTFSYSPVPDDDGGAGGIICANTDDTRRVIGERQIALLRDLAAHTANSRSWEEACLRGGEALGTNRRDLPFAAIYVSRPGEGGFELAAVSGIEAGHPAVPRTVSAGDGEPWDLAAASASSEIRVVEVPSALAKDLPTGDWEEPPRRIGLVPISSSGQTGRGGVLVVGLNPFRRFDEGYGNFLTLLAGEIAASVASAQAFEEERRRAEALAELDRAKTLFFTNVSHELRTPLTLMLGPIEDLLEEGGAGPRQRELALLAQRSGLRLLKLVNTLLDFSRLEAGRMQAVFEPTDLSRQTMELASTFRAATEKAGLSLVVDCPPLGEPIWVDRDLWEKIVLNLLSNAFKFTLEGEIGVELKLEGSTVVLTVRDTGVGIPEAELEHVFERFHRVEGVERRSHEGTGIGLALVRELVELHGGRVSVESEVGSGSRFVVSLPLGSDHLPRERVEGTRTQVSTSIAPELFAQEASGWIGGGHGSTAAGDVDGGPEAVDGGEPGRSRVLLADDNSDLRAYVGRLLSERFEVEEVADGTAALAAMKRRAPDLLLTDVMMPGLDGFELLDRVRSDPDLKEVPVIMLSARAGEEARIEGARAGADDYLVKPFSARELLARVEAHLRLRRERRRATRALRESEARFRNMADNAPVMIWVTEPDGSCSYLSQRWYDFTGQTPETGLGFGWLEAVHPEDRPESERVFLAANEGRESFRLEYRLRRSDGEYRWAIDSAVPRFDVEGTFRGYIGSVIDITDRKEMENALVEGDRRKDEFLAMLAHELRNPLAPIRNAVEVMRLARGDEALLARSRETIERQLVQLVRLVDDLLDVSRITRDRVEISRERIRVLEVVESAVETSRPVILEHRHDLAVSCPDEDIWLEADLTRLTQVVANLLNNAAKYTPDGGRIELVVEAEGSEVVIRVRDDGVGIPAEMLPRVFELFQQGNGSPTRSTRGLGIGLTLVERLVRLHGGTVEARSAGPGRGSEFVVRLPRSRVTAAGVVATTENPGDGNGVRRRVLVVDDNRDAADSLCALIRLMGHGAEVAYDGPSALEAARSEPPEIVLLDLGMPGMDGLEVARRLRDSAPTAAATLVAVTGWGQEQDRKKSSAAGFDHHLTKPVDPAAVERLLGS